MDDEIGRRAGRARRSCQGQYPLHLAAGLNPGAAAKRLATRPAPEQDHPRARDHGDDADNGRNGNGALAVLGHLERAGVDDRVLVGEGDVVDRQASDADGDQHRAEYDNGPHEAPCSCAACTTTKTRGGKPGSRCTSGPICLTGLAICRAAVTTRAAARRQGGSACMSDDPHSQPTAAILPTADWPPPLTEVM